MVLISYVPSGQSLPEPQGDRGMQFLWLVDGFNQLRTKWAEFARAQGDRGMQFLWLVDGFNQLRTKWAEFARAPGWQRYAVSLVGGWF